MKDCKVTGHLQQQLARFGLDVAATKVAIAALVRIVRADVFA